MAVSASFGLAGCAAIDELRVAFLRWVESEKLPSAGGDLPDATPTIPPEKPLQESSSQAPKKTKKAARKPPQPQTLHSRERNHRFLIPPRRQGQKAPRGNPHRLRRCRRSCLVAGRQHRHPDVFHAKRPTPASGLQLLAFIKKSRRVDVLRFDFLHKTDFMKKVWSTNAATVYFW
jgi:hypothetical protein